MQKTVENGPYVKQTHAHTQLLCLHARVEEEKNKEYGGAGVDLAFRGEATSSCLKYKEEKIRKSLYRRFYLVLVFCYFVLLFLFGSLVLNSRY